MERFAQEEMAAVNKYFGESEARKLGKYHFPNFFWKTGTVYVFILRRNADTFQNLILSDSVRVAEKELTGFL